jgi:beta-lactam-binding protein with PASTA domain
VQTVSGITVHLSISNGVAGRVTLPSVKGLSVDSARYALSSIHITANIVERSTNDWTLDGIVFGMNPDAGTTVVEGSSVTLLVWNGPPPPSPSPSPGGGGGGGGGNGGGGNGGGNGQGNLALRPEI